MVVLDTPDADAPRPGVSDRTGTPEATEAGRAANAGGQQQASGPAGQNPSVAVSPLPSAPLPSLPPLLPPLRPSASLLRLSRLSLGFYASGAGGMGFVLDISSTSKLMATLQAQSLTGQPA